MRIAIVAESFLPQVNGVSNTVRHVVDELTAAGHGVLVVAPGPGDASYAGATVVRLRSFPLPGYAGFPVGLPDRRAVADALAAFAPDVVHLASPAVLGAAGVSVARRLGLPTVAVFQTDLAGFVRQYRLRADPAVWAWIRRVHTRADRTLAPSTVTAEQLRTAGVPRVSLWRRGVNLDLFRPVRRDLTLRRRLASNGELLVGYVGRLAVEKQVRRLTRIADLPATRLVVVGDGPERAALERALPGAAFLGMLRGEQLARAFASLDVFVHTGEHETFCQTVQEAQASGVATVVPAAGGPLDLVEHRASGMLFDPARPGDLRRAVSDLVQDDALRARVADGGAARVAGRGWGRVVDELVARHYGAVLQQPVGRAA
ncbi:MAG: glycosyltransferase family 1 protein [Actinomycetota bacterium]|nr:glycosyltransferase family 1 protein [Actinomycetota bacterium]